MTQRETDAFKGCNTMLLILAHVTQLMLMEHNLSDDY